ncbi:MAG TPA: hypothetical protein VGX03_28930, partial [Candidatus Binatia bacterium]|nr:hypothetical protein [Candidatus Binatia bacterium]
MATQQILVLLHQKDYSFDSIGYLIKPLMREWEAMGFTVQVMQGIKHHARADLVIPHVNLTITPKEYRDFFLAYPHVINRHVVDISKSRVSPNLVKRNDGYTGPVIIKTERNYGGLPEQRLYSQSRLGQWKWVGVARRLLPTLRRRDTEGISWRSVQSLHPTDYPVFPSVQEVPEGVFANRNLVVEKFLPEIAEGDYCLRYYYFFGSAGVNFLFRSKERVIKAVTDKVEEAPIPEELYEMRKRLG